MCVCLYVPPPSKMCGISGEVAEAFRHICVVCGVYTLPPEYCMHTENEQIVIKRECAIVYSAMPYGRCLPTLSYVNKYHQIFTHQLICYLKNRRNLGVFNILSGTFIASPSTHTSNKRLLMCIVYRVLWAKS